MFSLAQKVLFALDPEVSHELALDAIGAAERLNLSRFLAEERVSSPVDVMGLKFPNRVGLAAGLDKNADYFNGLGKLGFGFIEVGTITPRAQHGNPKPRLFRLPEANAIINRLGFNNKGIDHLIENVKHRRYDGVLGINIGKNRDTPVEKAVDDYVCCFNRAYEYADYITVNLSSPNTPGLRDLQFGEALERLLGTLKTTQKANEQKFGRYVPLAVKIAPDMEPEEVEQLAEALLANEMDGVIATNTTIDRDQVENLKHGDEAGGLSGAPVFEKSTQMIRMLSKALDGQLPIIGVGGITSGDDAKAKIEAGASLVQIYSGFIYRGPKLIREAAEALR
ncbi:MAG: quinone-dependent dihydroorotate dehydrogenase [Cellvibrionaceae bacterium]